MPIKNVKFAWLYRTLVVEFGEGFDLTLIPVYYLNGNGDTPTNSLYISSYDIFQKIKKDKDMLLFFDFDLNQAVFTKKEMVKITEDGYEVSYFIFDINTGEEVSKR